MSLLGDSVAQGAAHKPIGPHFDPKGTRVIYLPGSQGQSDDGGIGDLLRGLQGGLPQ